MLRHSAAFGGACTPSAISSLPLDEWCSARHVHAARVFVVYVALARACTCLCRIADCCSSSLHGSLRSLWMRIGRFFGEPKHGPWPWCTDMPCMSVCTRA